MCTFAPSPMSTNVTSVLFEAVMDIEKSASTTSLLKELVNSGNLNNVQDSAAVWVFLQSGITQNADTVSWTTFFPNMAIFSKCTNGFKIHIINYYTLIEHLRFSAEF